MPTRSGLPAAGHASLALSERLSAEPGEITLVGIGSLTNIATALSLDPGLATAAKEIVVIDGVFQGQTGQGSIPGVFNMWADLEAAEAVLRCAAPLRFVGLDVTRMVRLTRAQAVQLGQAPADSFHRFAAESAIAWTDHMHAHFPGEPEVADSCAMHDPLAVAVVSHPELVTRRPAHVKAVTGYSPARSVMVTDLLEGEDPPEANCQIAVSVDGDAFMDYFLGALSRI